MKQQSLIRKEASDAAPSGIVEVFHYGRDSQGRERPGLLPLWVGEGDLATPDFIVAATEQSLAAGETFYTAQRGLPAFRSSIAAMMTRVYGGPFAGDAQNFSAERFFATIGGMHALQIATRLTAGAGDEAIVLTPAWPNFIGSLTLAGATPIEVPLSFDGDLAHPRWRLDMQRLADAITSATRVIFVNSPANPTGWTATSDELSAILALARQYGLWIVADEIYGRFIYEGERAPSLHDVIAPEDNVLFVQSLSKNWAMTGWRVGWLEAPESLGPTIENLIQYSSSGVPTFIQRGAIAALDQGDNFIAKQVLRASDNRSTLMARFAGVEPIRFAAPMGAFYLFLAIAGENDSRKLAFRLIDECGVGLAPGSAFGAGGASFLRLCFARSPEKIAEAAGRIADFAARAAF